MILKKILESISYFVLTVQYSFEVYKELFRFIKREWHESQTDQSGDNTPMGEFASRMEWWAENGEGLDEFLKQKAWEQLKKKLRKRRR